MVEISQINLLLDEINNDRTVPKNIRSAVVKSKEDLNNTKMDITMRISSAICFLDESANDPNLPSYTRTQLMQIVSLLEILNQENNF
jgi:uncharacterized protein (UPF0147 family)